MYRYDAVLFDIDGTILDSKPGILDTMAYTLAQFGVDLTGVDLSPYIGPPLRKSFSNHLPQEQVESAVEVFRTRHRQHGSHLSPVYPGAEEMLRHLKKKGILLCTATCKPVPVLEPILVEQGIRNYFSVLGGASLDGSAETKTAVIRWVMAQPQLAGKRVLMVGDRADDLQGAADCGLPAAVVLYGYGSAEESAPYQPVFRAADCKALEDYILEEQNV